MSSFDSESTYSVVINKPKPSSVVGASFIADEEGIKVASITPDGLAAGTDLKKGDKVISINGQSVESMTAKESVSILRSAKGPVEIVAVMPSIEDEGEEIEDDMEDEEAPLIAKSDEGEAPLDDGKIAESMSSDLGLVILLVQVVAAVGIFKHFDYGEVDEFTTQKYIIFRDVMVMLLLGFGYCKSLFCERTTCFISALNLVFDL